MLLMDLVFIYVPVESLLAVVERRNQIFIMYRLLCYAQSNTEQSYRLRKKLGKQKQKEKKKNKD